MEEKHQTLKELPVSERPYEKCEKNGTAMLSDAELLAVILRSGTKDQTAIDLATKVLLIDRRVCRYKDNILLQLCIRKFQFRDRAMDILDGFF